MKRSYFVLSASMVLMFTGCFSKNIKKGTDFDFNFIHEIIIGKTTKQNIINWFGEPLTSTTTDDGKELFKYEYVHVHGDFIYLFVTMADKINRYEKNLNITFRDDIVSDFKYFEAPIMIDNFNKRYRFSNLSVIPPRDERWYICMLSNEGIFFVRNTDRSESQSIVAFITVHDLTSAFEGATTVDQVVEMHISKDKNDKRYKNYKVNKVIFSMNSFQGYKVVGSADDFEVPNSIGIPYRLNAVSIYLTHPSLERKLIILGYSQRYREGLAPIDLEKEIKPMVESLRYEVIS